MSESEKIPLYNAGRFEGELELAPGQKVVPLPDEVEASRVAMVDWQPQGDNTYRPVARIHERWMRLSQETVRRLGMGLSYKTLARLIRADFVRGRQVSPGVWLVDLVSYEAHCQAVEEDPECWEHPDNLERYKRALA